ncbi:MAG: electron transfer flavoprotein subunit alpha/FixB family protein [Fimbriimonas ginsengisoli]|uniref:Electron transfer flavoprotein subunit alpha/FixB family protein n=1 Tax=Fimbriimonas ginsengisoli TaxID=1005039 RepID=A0A931PST5_FIMGI|nr:electron transfer flavoprotein subunit alpha/FixB family protein [Fimbriimonas ginsengisoli]
MGRLLLVAFEPHEAAACAGFAHALGLPFDVLALSGEPDADLGAGKTMIANLSEIPPADGIAKAIAEVARDYSHIAAISSMQSKDVLARVAGLLDAAMVTDATAVQSPTIFQRPMVAGSIIATVETLCEPVVLTIRPAGFLTAQRRGVSPSEPVQVTVDSKAKRLGATNRGGARPDLTQARIVVSGGRPLRDAATFEKVIGGLADALSGAVGATRAAVDSGIAPNELQVGQTGKIVAPELYIAAGISGSTQHMAGIKDSKIIVAINKDPDAPIFEAADFGLVMDLFDAVPELERKVRG